MNAFIVLLYKYLMKCFHKTKFLENKYKDWLSGEIYFCCKRKDCVSNVSRGRPPKTDIHIIDMSTEIKVKSLLDHTTHRIIQLHEEVIDAYMEDVDSDVLTFVYKWGIDGISNQFIYKQS